MRWNYPLIVGCTYIAFIVGIAAGDVGEIYEASGPTSWWLPLALFSMLSVPFICGYFAGKEACKN